MRYVRTKEFRECFQRLPSDIQERVKEKFILFKQLPWPPYPGALSIKLMKGYRGVWEGHVSPGYVFTFHVDNDRETGEITIVFRKIGRR